MDKLILRLAILSSPLLLAACGEGWEMQRTDQISPYGNQRTAGSGVAYVRAKMLPEKELKIETASEKIIEVEEVVETKPILDAEEIFTEQQTKGGATPSPEKPAEEITETEKHSSNTSKELEIDISETKTSTASAEEYIAQEPKKIENVEIDISEIDISELEPLAGNMEEEFDGFDMEFEESETIEIYENEVSQPLKQIIVPKRDFMDLRTSGEKSIDEIYNDEFISSF